MYFPSWILFGFALFSSSFSLSQPLLASETLQHSDADVLRVSESSQDSSQPKAEMLIQGIALVGHVQDLSSHPRAWVEIHESVHVPGSIEELQTRLEPFLGRILDSEELLRIQSEILRHFDAHRQNLVMIEIPEQEISSGVVSFVVSSVQVDDISYKGSHWYPERNIQRQVALQPGDVLDQDLLMNRMAWLNQNPFHYTKAVISPGQTKGSSNLEIVTKDRFPLRVYGGVNNAGLESTGITRFSTGVTWSMPYDLFTYQFASSLDPHQFYSHSANAVSYLPWQHILMVCGGYAKIHPDAGGDFRSEGTEAFASVRYKIPFKPLYTPFQQQLYLGFDYKYVTSDLFFVGQLNLSSTNDEQRQVDVAQIATGYILEYTPLHHRLTFEAELCTSPFGWLPHQNNRSYSAMRKGAKPYYLYTILSFGDLYTLPSKEVLSFLLRIQGATNALIPSEQLSLGGYNTVRGYDQSVFISDNAVCLNLELRSRPVRFWRKVRDDLTLLAFVDYGWGYNFRAFDGIKTMANLLGVGSGLRYNIPPYVNLRVDFGFKLSSVNFDDNRLGMWHVGATVGY